MAAPSISATSPFVSRGSPSLVSSTSGDVDKKVDSVAAQAIPSLSVSPAPSSTRFRENYHRFLDAVDEVRLWRILKYFGEAARLINNNRIKDSESSTYIPDFLEQRYVDEMGDYPSLQKPEKTLLFLSCLKKATYEIKELYVHSECLKGKTSDNKLFWQYLENFSFVVENLLRVSENPEHIFEKLSVSLNSFATVKLPKNPKGISTHFEKIARELMQDSFFIEIATNHQDKALEDKIVDLINRSEGFNVNSFEGRASLLYAAQTIGELSGNFSSKKKAFSVYCFLLIDYRNEMQHIWDSTGQAGRLISCIEGGPDDSFQKIKQMLLEFRNELVVGHPLASLKQLLTEVTDLLINCNNVSKERLLAILSEKKAFLDNAQNLKKKILENLQALLSKDVTDTIEVFFGKLIAFRDNPGGKSRGALDGSLSKLKDIYKSLTHTLAFQKEDLLIASTGSASALTLPLEQAYIWKQLDLMRYLIEHLRQLTRADLAKCNGDWEKIKELYKSDEKLFACLYILTAIGESSRNLFTQKAASLFFLHAPPQLADELEFLKWVRNSLAHASERLQNIYDKACLFDYFGNDLYNLPISLQGGKRVEFIHYFENLLKWIEEAKKRVENPSMLSSTSFQDGEKAFYEKRKENQLRKFEAESDFELVRLFKRDRRLDTQKKELNLEDINENIESIQKLASEIGVEIVGLFGPISYFGFMATEDNGGFLVKLNKTDDPFHVLVRFKQALHKLLNFRVKVVLEEHVKERFESLGNEEERFRAFLSEVNERRTLQKLLNGYNFHVAFLDEDYEGSKKYISEGANLDLVLVERDSPNPKGFSNLAALHLVVSEIVSLNKAISSLLKVRSLLLKGGAIRSTGIKSLLTTIAIEEGLEIKWVENEHAALVSQIKSDHIEKRLVDCQNKRESLMELISLMLKHGANINIQDRYGLTPLHSSALDGEPVLTALFLEKGADPNLSDFEYSSPLDNAIKYFRNSIAKKLIDHGAVCGLREGKKSSLYIAARYANKEIFDYILEKYPDMDTNLLDEGNQRAIHHALEVWTNPDHAASYLKKSIKVPLVGAIEMVKARAKSMIMTLIERNSSGNPARGNKETLSPLHWAYTHAPKLFLQLVCNSDQFNYKHHGTYLLHLAVRRAKSDRTYLEALKWMVGKCHNLNCELRDAAETPLAMAIRKQDLASVQVLVEGGADVNYKIYRLSSYLGETSEEIFQYLAEKGLRINYHNISQSEHLSEAVRTFAKNCHLLIEAIAKDDLESVKDLHETQRVPLTLCTERGISLQNLIEGRSLVKCHTYFQEKGFLFDLTVLETLNLDNLAHDNPYKKIFNALYRGDLKEFKSLHKTCSGIQWNIQLYSPAKKLHAMTLLHFSISEGKSQIAEYILNERLISVDQPDSMEQVPLLFAFRLGDLELVKLLFSFSPNLFPQGLESPLFAKELYDDPRIIEIVSKHITVTVKKELDKHYLLHRFTAWKNVNAVSTLLKWGASVNVGMESGNPFYEAGDTPLHIASRNNLLDIATILLQQKELDINLQNDQDSSPLHIAASHNHLEMGRLLLSHPSIKLSVPALNFILWATTGSRTPLEFSLELGHYAFAKLLIESGAAIGKNLSILILYALKYSDFGFLDELLNRSLIHDKEALEGFLRSWQSDSFSLEDFKVVSENLEKVKSKIPTYIYSSLFKWISRRLTSGRSFPKK